MYADLKDTLIILISKIKNQIEPSHFRPISLCEMIYKVDAIMILNRLRYCLPNIIIEEQVAFISGRSMSDHCTWLKIYLTSLYILMLRKV